jgi:hypothetical protein
MRAQINIISVVIIAGIVIALIGMAYVWAVPMIEKRMTITDYDIVEGFMLELDWKIVDIANTGSGEARIEIPNGVMDVLGYDFPGAVNNTITLDFQVSQPIMMVGSSVPIETNNLDYIGEYGKAEPRIILMSRSSDEDRTHLNMSIRYRELRSTATQKGYIIALCPTGFDDCSGSLSGGNEVTLSFDKGIVEPRDLSEGGPLTTIYINIGMN